MKIRCDFCKTEYNIARVPATPVKCAVCGHTWVVRGASRGNAILLVASALGALIAAGIFATAAITRHRAAVAAARPMVATVDHVGTVTDTDGVAHVVVRGRVMNQSDQIYGVPDLIVIARDGDDHIVARQRVMPTATLLDAGTSAEFSHTLSVPATTVRRISVELSGGDLND
ncbi:hypothetical protein HDR63_01660 [bacterium]|nr:hypothetical protein [bacterium]